MEIKLYTWYVMFNNEKPLDNHPFFLPLFSMKSTSGNSAYAGISADIGGSMGIVAGPNSCVFKRFLEEKGQLANQDELWNRTLANSHKLISQLLSVKDHKWS